MRLLNKLLLDKQQIELLRQTVAQSETKTSAEIVTVLCARSDNYHYIPLLWASFIALTFPLLSIWLFPLPLIQLYISQLVIFMSMALLFKIPLLHSLLIPKSVRHWRAANMARRLFLENNLHHTRDETGVLIFVSVAEQYVEIITDRGIRQTIDDTQWQSIITQFIIQVKAGNNLQGFIDCVTQCSQLLSEHFPADKHDNPNELPDHLIILD